MWLQQDDTISSNPIYGCSVGINEEEIIDTWRAGRAVLQGRRRTHRAEFWVDVE
jgi:hypothetical protein